MKRALLLLLSLCVGATARAQYRPRPAAATNLAAPGPIGGTTPGSGAFTTLTMTGQSSTVPSASFSRAGPVFVEYKNTNSTGTPWVSFGMLGTPEANISFNMNYRDGVHRYYDSSYNAVWMALGTYGWQVQFAPTGQTADIWTNSGQPLLLYQSVDGHLKINTTAALVSSGGFDGMLAVPRDSGMPSITGTSDLVIEGAKTKGTTGVLYLNAYNTGNVVIANGGGTAIHGGPSRFKGYTVATLPAGTVGDTAYVTDATAPTYNGTLTGGGAVVTLVFFDGISWKSH